ncbi:hypothetical protein PY247_16175 [Acinetobacter proteolyticus]|nr:hypothetical protein [Acinetobacter proteolyticus]WEI17873.1 hypothetical protein PY247_16175 [Acinetobacter proteolyticus]
MNCNALKLILISLALGSCATVPTERAKVVSKTGKEYVVVLKKVNELALDESIDFTADLLPKLPRTKIILENNTMEIKKRAELIGKSNEYYDNLSNYFSELELLINGDQSEVTSQALSDLATTLKKEPIELKLSDEKKESLTGLSAYVTKQIHSIKVQNALKRDADTIAQALAISEKMLDEQIKWISLREKAIRDAEYITKIEKPFLSNAQLTNDWKNDWKKYAKQPPVIVLLEEAKNASKEMQKSWKNILRGDYSNEETLLALSNIKKGLDAVKTLKESE